MIHISLQKVKDSISKQDVFNGLDYGVEECGDCQFLRVTPDANATGDSPEDVTCDGSYFECPRFEDAFNEKVEDEMEEMEQFVDEYRGELELLEEVK